MNFLAILKQLFQSRPDLEEFIALYNPQSIEEVESLEKQYHRIVSNSGFYH